MAFSHKQHLNRPYIHALRNDDAGCNAAWSPSAFTHPGFQQVPHRTHGGRTERQSENLGRLQHCRTEVCLLVLLRHYFTDVDLLSSRVATGYGQPPSTLYDWTLSSGESADPNFKLPSDIRSRLDIENFCDKITKALYNNRRDPVGLSSDSERSAVVSLLSRDFDDLEDELRSDNDGKTCQHNSLWRVRDLTLQAITELYLRASNLHLHLSAFFDNPTAKDYREGLLSLHSATTAFLEAALNLETHVGPVLSYTPYYIYQMMLAAGFTLLKLCKSFFAAHIDLEYSRNLFNRTIWAIRAISVSNNDLPERLAEVLAQMWRLGGTPSQRPTGSNAEIDDSLQLRVRCRMSMSLVYDSVWRWREDAQTRGRNIEGTIKCTA